MATPTPEYDYVTKGDRKVTHKLVQEYGHNYRLMFTTCDLDSTAERLMTVWYPVSQYCLTHNEKIQPGVTSEDVYRGNWIPRIFYVESAEDGRLLLDKLRTEIHTVRDIFNKFIKEGLEARKGDLEKYQAYQARCRRLPEDIV